MLSRRATAAALAAAAITIPLALAAPASASAHPPAILPGPRILLGENFDSQNTGTALWLHAHCNDCIMTTASAGLQSWWTGNAQRWVNNNGVTVTTVQVQLNGSRAWCMTWDSDGFIRLHQCVTGFGNGSQQWWVPAVSGGDQFINADASAHTPDPPHNYVYATDARPHHELIGDAPVLGTLARWAAQCLSC